MMKHNKKIKIERYEHGAATALSRLAPIMIWICLFVLAATASSYASDVDLEAERRIAAQKIAALTLFAAVDFRQSADLLYRSSGYHELNPVLGEHPSRLDLAAFGTLGVALTYALTEILGDRYPMLSRTLVNSVVKSEQMNIEWNQMALNGQQRSAQFVPVLITWEW